MKIERGPWTWDDAVTAWRTWQRAAGRSPDTIRIRTYYVRRAAHDLAAAGGPATPGAVALDDLIIWSADQDWQDETRRSAHAALKAFYRWATATGRVDDDPAAGLPIIRIHPPNPRPAPDDAIATGLDTRRTDVRRMIRLAAELAMRRAEIARVRTDDLVDTPRGPELVIHGKGGRSRTVPVPADLAAEIRALPPGWIFPSPAPGRDDGHLTPGHVGRLISRALPGQWTAHRLRSAAATAWADPDIGDLDIDEVAQLLGHARVDTTRVYVLRRSAVSRAAVERAARRLPQVRRILRAIS